LSTDSVIAAAWTRPISANNRVARPTKRKAPTADSTSNVNHPKNKKCGSTTCLRKLA
jgi:hypothetical protein